MQLTLRSNHMLSHNNIRYQQNLVIHLSQYFLRHLHQMLNKNHTFATILLISQYPFQYLKVDDTQTQKYPKHNDLAIKLTFYLFVPPVFLQIIYDLDDLKQN